MYMYSTILHKGPTKICVLEVKLASSTSHQYEGEVAGFPLVEEFSHSEVQCVDCARVVANCHPVIPTRETTQEACIEE